MPSTTSATPAGHHHAGHGDRRARLRQSAAVVVPTACAAVIASWNMGRPSMIGTEAVTFWAAQQRPGVLAHVLQHVDVVHGTYYALIHLLFQIHTSTLVMRLPSALGMTAAVALTGVVAARLTGSDLTAFLCAGSLATFPLLSNYAGTARSYALDTAVAALATYLLVRCVQARDGRRGAGRWAAYAGTLTVCVYLHEFTILLVAAHAVTLAWARVPRRTFAWWAAGTTLAVAAGLPLLVYSSGQAGQVGYIRAPDAHTVPDLLLLCLGPSTPVAAVNGSLAVLGLASGVLLRRHRAEHGLTLTRVAFPLFVVPPALLIGESVVAHPYYGGSRYVLHCVTGLALLVGAGLDVALRALRSRGVAAAVGPVVGGALLLGLFVAQLPLQLRQHSARGESQDLIGAARYLHAHTRPGDAVLFAPRSLYSVALAYPDAIEDLDDIGLARSAASSGTLYGTGVGRPELHRRIAAHRRIWLLTSAPPTRPAPPQLALLARGYHLQAQSRLRAVSVLLFVRTDPDARRRRAAGPRGTGHARVRVGGVRVAPARA